MAELDIERLRQLSERAKRATTLASQRTMASESGWLKIEELDAIIAALEDRDHLRAAARDVLDDAYDDHGYCVLRPGTIKRLRAALEGRDG